MDTITEDELRELVKSAIEEYGTQAALADAMEIPASMVSNIVNRKMPIPDKVARFFGRRLVKFYVKEGG